jgi:hypothetical protein
VDAVLPPETESGLQVGNEHHVRKKGVNHLTETVFDLDEIEEPACVAIQRRRTVTVHAYLPRAQRNEAAPPGGAGSQGVHGTNTVVFGTHDHVLQPVSKRRSDSSLVLLWHSKDIRNDAEDSVRTLRVEQHGTHAGLVALVVPMDLAQRLQP